MLFPTDFSWDIIPLSTVCKYWALLLISQISQKLCQNLFTFCLSLKILIIAYEADRFEKK